MASGGSALHLYHLTLQKPTSVTAACAGNFSAAKKQEIAVVRAQRVLELLRVDEAGKLRTVYSREVFGVVHALQAFRLTGAPRDQLIVASDAGRVTVLEWSEQRGEFVRVHMETYGRSGCRRVIPGQYLASDYRGRAFMIGAMEKQKLVYVLNRDTAARLTISSPLEAHKANTVCFDMVGVDVGYDNPLFACLELDYGDADEDPTGEAARNVEKVLTYYELDLGLNHVVRKWSDRVERTAHKLVSVPGGGEGPSGVLVCSEGKIVYRHHTHEPVEVLIPRRSDDFGARLPLVTAVGVFRLKAQFWALVQVESGDLFRLTLTTQDDTVIGIQMTYFDTIAPCSTLIVLRTGFLFAAAEFGSHTFYQFVGLAEDALPNAPYTPHDLQNLQPVDEHDSLAPMTDMRVAEVLGEDAPQVFTICGRGSRATFRMLRHGLSVAEMACSQLPGRPSAVYSVRSSMQDSGDRYIVVSFTNATLVLAIGETVEEVTTSGIRGDVPTLSMTLLGDDSMLQVYPRGMRMIRPNRPPMEWQPPADRVIERCSANGRQVLLSLSGNLVMYFELDETDTLDEVASCQIDAGVLCLGVAPLPPGQRRGDFVAVGTNDSTVRLLSLAPGRLLEMVAMQACTALPSSVALVQMKGHDVGNVGTSLYLNIGLENGVLQRTVLDANTSALSDVRQRFLGPHPVKLCSVVIDGGHALLAVGARSYLAYYHNDRFHLTPLSYETLDFAAPFNTEAVMNGVCAVAGNTLRIFVFDRLGETFNQSSLALTYTPRKFVLHAPTQFFVVAESDMQHSADPSSTVPAALLGASASAGGAGGLSGGASAAAASSAAVGASGGATASVDDAVAMEIDDAPPRAAVPAFGGAGAGTGAAAGAGAGAGAGARGSLGQWRSLLRVVDARGTMSSRHELPLPVDEAAFSVAEVAFPEHSSEVYVAVGTATGLAMHPRRMRAAAIHLFRVTNDGKLELVHSTPVEDVPLALCAYQGRLLAGVGRDLRLYDFGKKKLLKKTEFKNIPNTIVSLRVTADRIIAGDMQQSAYMLRYRRADNIISFVCDHAVPHWMTTAEVLDYDTVAGADKFGNVFVARAPKDASDDLSYDPMMSLHRWERPLVNTAPFHYVDLCNFHLGDIAMQLQKASLVPGVGDALFYCTVGGAIGVLLPFLSREDVDFFTNLEMHLRQEAPPLCGRDHMMYRSYYFPVKNVIDGDLCEQFSLAERSVQHSIGEALDRTESEVSKKLEDIRNRVL